MSAMGDAPMRLLLAPLLLLAMSRAAATDLILYNGKLWTGDAANPSATALAIEDGRITAVGDDATSFAVNALPIRKCVLLLSA